MKQRIETYKTAPDLFKAMMALEEYGKSTGFDHKLKELIKIRSSQINGCAYCLDMHTKDAKKYGETDQRLNLIAVWREAPFFTQQERLVLELTEAVTQISHNGVSDDLYGRVREHFDEKQFMDLVFLISTINVWNRLNISAAALPKEDK